MAGGEAAAPGTGTAAGGGANTARGRRGAAASAVGGVVFLAMSRCQTGMRGRRSPRPLTVCSRGHGPGRLLPLDREPHAAGGAGHHPGGVFHVARVQVADLFLAMSFTWAAVTLNSLYFPPAFASAGIRMPPFSFRSECRRLLEQHGTAGGDFVSNVNDRSEKMVITTGMVTPFMSFVRSLKLFWRICRC